MQLSQANNLAFWTECTNSDIFDEKLASFSGHPLQSVLWGNARYETDGIPQLLLEFRNENGEIMGLARVEKRIIPFVGETAWIPKGPVMKAENLDSKEDLLIYELKRRGFIACFMDRYTVLKTNCQQNPRTIWLDLTKGLNKLSKNLDSQWRYGANRAIREGVVVRTPTKPEQVYIFFNMCNSLSLNKGFVLNASEPLMLELIKSSSQNKGIQMILYIGEINRKIIGGALIAKSGIHIHYIWGASNRDYSKYRVNEAIQWKIIQDAVAANIERYDLEGIDPIHNPGVAQFKQKMGGTVVALRGVETISFTWVGSILIQLGKLFCKF